MSNRLGTVSLSILSILRSSDLSRKQFFMHELRETFLPLPNYHGKYSIWKNNDWRHKKQLEVVLPEQFSKASNLGCCAFTRDLTKEAAWNHTANSYIRSWQPDAPGRTLHGNLCSDHNSLKYLCHNVHLCLIPSPLHIQWKRCCGITSQCSCIMTQHSFKDKM